MIHEQDRAALSCEGIVDLWKKWSIIKYLPVNIKDFVI
jgi:hypothetical protein